MDAIERFRSMAELLSDPQLAAYKHACCAALSSAAQGVLFRHCRALLDHCWGLVERECGIKRSQPFCVVYAGSRYCSVAVTPDVDKAVCIATSLWGQSPSVAIVTGDTATVFRVGDNKELAQTSTVAGHAEGWLAMKLATVYARPAWLTAA